jgi:RNA polymerase sigma factor (sigma-70 family)
MSADTVYLVDDDPSIRDAIGLLLGLNGIASVPFASAEDLLGALQPGWRGCAVLDIRLGGMSGLELQARLRQAAPQLAVVVISAHGDVSAARRAFLDDAVDFIEKPFDGEQLLAAVRRALDRAGTAAVEAERAAALAPTLGQLSPREREVLQLLRQGHANKHIAETLGISHRTVEVHKARVLDKLGVRSVVELLRLAGAGP